MLNKLLFPKTYTKRITLADTTDLRDLLGVKVFKLKDDPYHGIDPAIENRIHTKYLAYQEKDKVFLYYSRAFLEAPHSGKPFFPYFKGTVTEQGGTAIVTGKVKYNKLLDIMLPVSLLAIVILILILQLHFAFLAVPVLLLLIVKVSAGNLEREMISDFGFSEKTAQQIRSISE